jgi:hypothetical protein
MRFLHLASLALFSTTAACFFIAGLSLTFFFFFFIDLTGGLNYFKRPEFLKNTMSNTVEIMKLVQFAVVNAFVARFTHQN